MKQLTWPVVAGLFCGYSLFAALVSVLFTSASGVSLWSLESDATTSVSYILAMNLVLWGGWAMFAPLIVWLARRAPFERTRWRLALLVHAPASLVVTSCHLLWVGSGRFALQRAFGVDAEWWPTVWDAFFRTLDFELPVYWALVGVQHVVDYDRRLRAREVHAARLETRLVEARLQALQQQLYPHFLFNTLHAVSTLVHSAPDVADAMLERLSDLLRMTLRISGVPEIPLLEELDYLRAYLEIEQVHFGDRLTVEMRIDPAARDALVPTLLLQPLAENAIRHGLERKTGPGKLIVTGGLAGGVLTLAIRDNGLGLHASETRHGVGLSNTRSRLHHLYGTSAALVVRDVTGGGVLAEVTLPYRPALQDSSRGSNLVGQTAHASDKARG